MPLLLHAFACKCIAVITNIQVCVGGGGGGGGGCITITIISTNLSNDLWLAVE